MFKRLFLFILALSFVLPSIACSPPWKVIRKADPNPFHKQVLFAVGKAFYRGLKIGDASEEVYVQKMNAEEKKQWASDKAFFSNDFRKSLKKNATGLRIAARVIPKAFVVKPNISWIKLGKGKSNLKVHFRLNIRKKNSLYESIEMTIEVKPSEGATFSRRFRMAARKAGKLSAKYLKERAK